MENRRIVCDPCRTRRQGSEAIVSDTQTSHRTCSPAAQGGRGPSHIPFPERSVELDLQVDLLAVAQHTSVDGAAGLLTGQEEHVALQILDRLAVHFDDTIALANSGASGGKAVADATDQDTRLIVDVVGPDAEARPVAIARRRR